MLVIAAATLLATAPSAAQAAPAADPARDPLAFEPMPQPDEAFPTVMVDPAKAFQTIEGVGGALTDAAAETYAKLPPQRQREVLQAYFDPEKGIGYTLARTHINSCDFSSASYAYAEPGDVELRTFSVAPDRRFRLPFIREALAAARGPVKVFASPWSPPPWMKTNGDMLHGGKLEPEYRDAWAPLLASSSWSGTTTAASSTSDLHPPRSLERGGGLDRLFVRPGARRVAATSNDDRLLTAAFGHPDGGVAAVVLNRTDADLDFALWVDGRAAKAQSPAHSILTLTLREEP